MSETSAFSASDEQIIQGLQQQIREDLHRTQSDIHSGTRGFFDPLGAAIVLKDAWDQIQYAKKGLSGRPPAYDLKKLAEIEGFIERNFDRSQGVYLDIFYSVGFETSNPVPDQPRLAFIEVEAVTVVEAPVTVGPKAPIIRDPGLKRARVLVTGQQPNISSIETLKQTDVERTQALLTEVALCQSGVQKVCSPGTTEYIKDLGKLKDLVRRLRTSVPISSEPGEPTPIALAPPNEDQLAHLSEAQREAPGGWGEFKWPWDDWFKDAEEGGAEPATLKVYADRPPRTPARATYRFQLDEAEGPALERLDPARRKLFESLVEVHENNVRMYDQVTALIDEIETGGPNQLSNYKPGPFGAYSMNPDALRALVADKRAYSFEPINKALFAALESSPELNSFYSVAAEQGLRSLRVKQLAELYGFYKSGLEVPLYAGDLIYLAHQMRPGGGDFAVVIAAEKRVVREALICNPAYDDRAFSIRAGSNMGEVAWAWSPVPSCRFAEDSEAGGFWGPRMSRFKHLIEADKHADAFYAALFQGSSYKVRSYAAYQLTFGSELKPISQRFPVVPGAIVTNKEHGELAVALSDGAYFGLMAKDGFFSKRYDWREFGPRYIWYPYPHAA